MSHFREDRFFSPIPFVSQEDFGTTNYLQLYDKTEPFPTTNRVIRSLRNLPNGRSLFSEVIDALESTSSEWNVIET